MEMVVLADPLEGLDPGSDTSLCLMGAALERGHRVFHTTPGALTLADGRLAAAVTPMRPGRGRSGPEPEGHEDLVRDLASVDLLMLRADPPVDAAFVAMTLLCETVRGRTVLVNDPRGLREANEKLLATRFPDLMPATVVTGRWSVCEEFLAEHPEAVIKPLDGHGGRDVVRLHRDGRGAEAFGRLTGHGRRPVMVQEFLDAVRDGDRRVLLLDGEPIGALLRLPAPGEFRANLALGATGHVVEPDADDRRIAARLAPELRARGLVLVGIDVIGGRLTEVNVTSPTGLVPMVGPSRRPDHEIVAWLERRVAES